MRRFYLKPRIALDVIQQHRGYTGLGYPVARPRIIVTGASGFVGRHLLDEIKECFSIEALARRSQIQCGAPHHPNIRWNQVDIAEVEPLTATFSRIREDGPVDALIHLAAHYDFTGQNSPEYARTNVAGLRNTLNLARTLDLRRFVFAGSVAACPFPKTGQTINESTSPDADNPYARSKRAGEILVGASSRTMPTCIARFAALYSDWCEYPPLFNFLGNWLSKGWNSRMIGGKGAFAIPYMHIRCAVSFLSHILRNLDLPRSGEVFIASPDGAVPLMEIFNAASLAFYGYRRRPVHVPKTVTAAWLHIQDAAGQAIGRRPFERPWMARYLERQLTVDASKTRQRLQWDTRPRFALIRRMPFLVENLRTQPVRWNEVNHAAMRKEEPGYGLKIQWLLEKHQEEICTKQVTALLAESTDAQFGTYRKFDREAIAAMVSQMIKNLRQTMRTREMEPVGGHCRKIAGERFRQGFSVEEVSAAVSNLGMICIEELKKEKPSHGLEKALNERISMAIQFGIDEVLDEFESLGSDGGNPCARYG
jgi:nucleoside-diphosphate-sugar epimerase